MSCESFDRWLDQGMPADQAAPARGHAATCARCAAVELEALALEALLASPPPPAPDGFADRVAARIAALRAARWTPGAGPFPWWVQVPAEPACALALVAAALLLWLGDRLPAAGLLLAASADTGYAGLARGASALALPLRGLDRPEARLGLAMAAAAALGWASPWLMRWSEGRVRRAASRRRAG